MPECGYLLGVLHDLAKYSSAFQTYIKSATGMLDPDIDADYVDSRGLRGKIDHSTAGAQWIWRELSQYGLHGQLAGQILAVCLASHHGGLLDCLLPNGTNGFLKRMRKDDNQTHLRECLRNMGDSHHSLFESVETERVLQECLAVLHKIVTPEQQEGSDKVKHFRIGFFTRFLFSCLVDADRIDSADFENPENKKLRRQGPVNWQTAIDRLEKKLATLSQDTVVNRIRSRIGQECLAKARFASGQIYSLTVPTGGGKTLASMRFALHHADKHGLDHIFYIIPYTSIIEQNTGVMREILEQDNDPFPWILEHHSNLEPELQTWHSKLTAENWDAPIIFTTMVQFLEVMFGGGTRGARRLHNLANSVIIFDEIQSLPVNCVHLFCNGLQFLVDHAGSTGVLCTATQPLLDGVDPAKGRLNIPLQNRLIDDVDTLFADLRRVEIEDCTKPGGWEEEEICQFTLEQSRKKGNSLVVVNTKAWAKRLFQLCREEVGRDAIFHLSTSLCPAHRKKILHNVIERLEKNMPVLCVSTQLIEAGVDVDFNCVIRFLAGLDSIAQAAGRCNRNGRLATAQVYVINPRVESIDMLEDIRIGRDQALRVLSEKEHDDLLHPDAMARYFQYYFYERAGIMDYPIPENQTGRAGETLFNLLSDNPLNVGRENNPSRAMFMLQQSFRSAGRIFQAIDAPTRALLVPYQKGRDIISELCSVFEPARQAQLLRQAQQYSVNVFPNVWKRLQKEKAVFPVQEGEEIYYLDERYYSNDFGLAIEPVSGMISQII